MKTKQSNENMCEYLLTFESLKVGHFHDFMKQLKSISIIVR